MKMDSSTTVTVYQSRPELPRKTVLVAAIALMPMGVCTIGPQIGLMVIDRYGSAEIFSASGIWAGLAAITTGICAVLTQQKANETRLLVLTSVVCMSFVTCLAAIAPTFLTLKECFHHNSLSNCDVILPMSAVNMVILCLETPFYAILVIAALKYYCCPPPPKEVYRPPISAHITTSTA